MIELISRIPEAGVLPCIAERVTLSDGTEWYVSYSPLLYGNVGGTEAFEIVDGEIDWDSVEGQGGDSRDAVIEELIQRVNENAEPEEYDPAADPIYDRDYRA